MKKFSWIRFVFALLAGGGIVCLWCLLHNTDSFSVTNITDGLFIAGALELLYSLEFIHTLLGHNASLQGSVPSSAYFRVKTNMKVYSEPERPVIIEYLTVAILAGAAGAVLAMLR